jgi:hypothetical protein
MRTTSFLLLGALALAAFALWAAPEAEASPYGSTAPVLADVYVGFGYGSRCAPQVRRTCYRPTYHYPRRYVRTYYVSRPYYHRPYYVRPYYVPRYTVRFGYHSYPRYRGYRHHHGHHHHGGHRAIGRRR